MDLKLLETPNLKSPVSFQEPDGDLEQDLHIAPRPHLRTSSKPSAQENCAKSSTPKPSRSKTEQDAAQQDHETEEDTGGVAIG